MVLPFGAIRSVHSFLRCARALWYVGLVKLKILWSSFYDDYVTLSRPSLVSSTQNSVQALFKLLGWLFATDGKKAEPFKDECVALGVQFDLASSAKGSIYVRNTESRVAELCSDLEALVQKGGVRVAHAGKRCMKVLSVSALSGWHKFSKFEVACIVQFVMALRSGPPREIRSNSWEQVCVFTDACFEAEAKLWKSGIGGVCFEDCDGQWEFFSVQLEDEHLEQLGANHTKQGFFEAETLAAVTAFMLWPPRFSGKVSFVRGQRGFEV